ARGRLLPLLTKKLETHGDLVAFSAQFQARENCLTKSYIEEVAVLDGIVSRAGNWHPPRRMTELWRPRHWLSQMESNLGFIFFRAKETSTLGGPKLYAWINPLHLLPSQR